MDEANFDQIVEDALDGLPEWAAAALDKVVMLVEEEDTDDPDLRGPYVGRWLRAQEELFGPPASWPLAQHASQCWVLFTKLHET